MDHGKSAVRDADEYPTAGIGESRNFSLPGDDDNNTAVHVDAICEIDFLGKQFSSWEKAGGFYNQYAKMKGFSIRKFDVKRKNDFVTAREWVCSKEGYRRANPASNDPVREPQGITRTGCKARFRICYDRNKKVYCVTAFHVEHNHDLVSSEDSYWLRSHREVSDATVASAVDLKSAGMRTCEVMNYRVDHSGGHENVGFIKRDLYNKMYEERKSNLVNGDAEGALGYLHAKASNDPQFFCKYDVDEEQRLRRLFWVDGQSRADYASFGDILVFDATYKTNAYSKPLVILCGVNNHFETVIFASALLFDESTETYEWVLQCFLEAMDNNGPTSVITDDDRAMRNAIEICLPTTVHRTCSWHLNRNATKHIKAPGFEGRFNDIMGRNCDVEEFEVRWQQMVSDFQLEENPWIKATYERRKHWAKAYLRGFFFADMTASQRCESMNAFFKKHVNRKLRLYEFVARYDRAFADSRIKCVGTRVNTEQSLPVLSTALEPLERHAALVYTRKIFFFVRDELKKVAYVLFYSKAMGVGVSTYVTHMYNDASTRLYAIEYTTSPCSLKCSCSEMEYRGWPCAHMFYVMAAEKMTSIPTSCILPRWTQNILQPGRTFVNPSHLKSTNPQRFRFGALTTAANEMSYYASQSSVGYEECLDEVSRLTGRFKKMYQNDIEGVPESLPEAGKTFNIRDPEVLPSRKDASGSSRATSVRRCGECRAVGHTKNKCPKNKEESHPSHVDQGTEQFVNFDPLLRPGDSVYGQYGYDPYYHGYPNADDSVNHGY